MATPSPIRVTTLIAYWETSVKRARKSVPPTPPTIARTPTLIGRRAATTEAKMSTRSSKVIGSATSSARCRSCSSVVLNASMIGTWPVAYTFSALGWISETTCDTYP
jgi:hypothetical protein